MNWASILAVGGPATTIGGVVTFLASQWYAKKRDDRESDTSVVAMTEKLREMYMGDLDKMATKISNLEDRVKELEAENKTLKKTIELHEELEREL